jgi:hypothetical protein
VKREETRRTQGPKPPPPPLEAALALARETKAFAVRRGGERVLADRLHAVPSKAPNKGKRFGRCRPPLLTASAPGPLQ